MVDSLDVIRSAVLAHPAVYVGDPHPFRRLDHTAFPCVSLRDYSGLIEVSPEDQVAVFRSGTTLREANATLAEYGYAIPMTYADVAGFAWMDDLPLSDLLALNLSHARGSRFGSWGEWTLGVTVLKADGTTFKSGSKAVKNVAGYDLQKLLIGARHTLGVVAEVILRLTPLASLPSITPASPAADGVLVVQKTRLTDFEAAHRGFPGSVVGVDAEAATLFGVIQPGQDVRATKDGFVLRSDQPLTLDPTLAKFMVRVKDAFDPARRLNPGEFGVI